MNNDDRNAPAPSNPSPHGPTTDAAGQPVDVVKRDLEDRDEDTRAVDEVITPTSIRTKEQEAEALKRKTDEIERKVADGN